MWNKTLADGDVAVALLNTGNFGAAGNGFGNFNATFSAEAVGLSCNSFSARDLFRKQDLGSFQGGLWKIVGTRRRSWDAKTKSSLHGRSIQFTHHFVTSSACCPQSAQVGKEHSNDKSAEGKVKLDGKFTHWCYECPSVVS